MKRMGTTKATVPVYMDTFNCQIPAKSADELSIDGLDTMVDGITGGKLDIPLMYEDGWTDERADEKMDGWTDG